MGTKRKIEIEKRDTKQQRSVTCNKRRKTVFSKAADLCRLSGANIAVFVTSPSEKSDVVYSFSGYSSASEISDCYLNGKLPPKIINPQSKLGFWWELDPDHLYQSCDDLSELNIIEDRLERMKNNLMALLEKKEKLQLVSDLDQNPSICSIDEIGSQFVSDLDDQIPSLCSVEEIGSQFVSDLDDQIPSLCSVEEMGSQFVSDLYDQNPKSSKNASFDQNSYSSLDEIYDKPSSQSFCLDGSSSPSQTCCLREIMEEYNSFSLAQETETQTDPMVNVGGYNDQNFWDNLYKDDVFGLNSDFCLDNNNNLQANTTNEQYDYTIDNEEFFNDEEIELLHFS